MDRKRRQYLRPWLEETLNKSRVPGVKWLNKEEQLFKLPWKRNSDQTTAEDFQIFRAWAHHTGREEEDDGSSAVYTKWKTRLRCAIHKAPDIKEEKSLHQTDQSVEEPFKAYRFLNTSNTHGYYSPRQSPSGSCDDSQESTYLAQSCVTAEIPAVVNQFDETHMSTSDAAVRFPSDLEMSGTDLIRGTRELSLSAAINSKGEVEDISEPLKLEQGMAPTTCATVVPPPVTAAEPFMTGMAIPAMPASLVTAEPSDNCVSMSSGLSATGFVEGASTKNGGHCLTVQIYYSRHCVVRQEVVNKCRVSHADPALPSGLLATMAGPQDVPKVEMPSCQEVSQAVPEKYIQVMQALLSKMQHGFVVDYEDNGDIYVTRYCQAVVFAEFANSVKIKKLVRSVRTKVFDQEVFETHLKQALKRTAKRPSCDVILVIGQQPVNDQSAYVMYVTVSGSKAASLLVILEQELTNGPALEMSVSDEYDNLCKHTAMNNGEGESMDTG